MLRGNCQTYLYCRYCDSIDWNTFDVSFLDHPNETCRVGDDVAHELIDLWRSYEVIRFPRRESDAQILESTDCSACGSQLWIRLNFGSGVLREVATVPLSSPTFAAVNYVTRAIQESFEKITQEPFAIDGRARSNWPGVLSQYRAYDGVWAKKRWLRVLGSSQCVTIDDDLTGGWSKVVHAALQAGVLHDLGVVKEVFELGDLKVGPAEAMAVPNEVRLLRRGGLENTWVLHPSPNRWTFISASQLRGLAAGAAVLADTLSTAIAEDPMSGRELDGGVRIIEAVAPRRYRALARDGRAAIVDVDGLTGTRRISNEPPGAPLGALAVPLLTRYCVSIGSQLAAWALQRPDGSRLPFELADVYVTFEPALANVTGVIPSNGHDYAPHEFLQQQPLTAAGDVFTICAIVAHLATGEHPFDEGERGIVDERRRAFWGDPQIARIVDRGLDREPGRRGTLEQLRDDFDKLRKAHMSNNDRQIVIRGGVTLTANLEGTGMIVSPLPSRDFHVVVTGPPGGPLSFLVWTPSADEHDAADGLERSVRRIFRLPPGPLEMASASRVALAGGERDALCLVEGVEITRTGWCIARIDHAGASAFVAFGCGVGSGSVSCELVLAHPDLRRIAETLEVMT